MITFDQATENVIKLHSYFLSHTSPPLDKTVFYSAVSHRGWSVSHMLVGMWKSESRYPQTLITITDYHLYEGAIVLPSNPAEAFLLRSHRDISVVPANWNLAGIAFDAFSRLPEIPIENRVATLGASLASWMSDNFQASPPELITSRTSICKECPYWSAKGYLGLGLCRKCGCSGLKVKMKVSKCPIGKW